MNDTPEFDPLTEELSDGDKVFILDTNQFDIYEAVLFFKDNGANVHFPEYPDDDFWTELPNNNILPNTPLNKAIFAKQEVIRKYKNQFEDSEIPFEMLPRVMMEADEAYNAVIAESDITPDSATSHSTEERTGDVESETFVFATKYTFSPVWLLFTEYE